ncbi:MAG: hypothetical protein ACQEP8_06200 [Chlamydiota bacterium]
MKYLKNRSCYITTLELSRQPRYELAGIQVATPVLTSVLQLVMVVITIIRLTARIIFFSMISLSVEEYKFKLL